MKSPDLKGWVALASGGTIYDNRLIVWTKY